MEEPVKKKKKHVVRNILLVLLGVIVAVAIFAVLALTKGKNTDKQYAKLMEESRTYMSEMRYDEAIECCKKAIEINPEATEAYQTIAEAYDAKGESETALDYLQSELKYASDEEDYKTAVDTFTKINEENDLGREIEEWNVSTDSYSASASVTSDGVDYSAEGMQVKALSNGNIYITICNTSVADEYEVNTHAAGEVEYEWKITIESSMGTFAIFARHISEGTDKKTQMSVGSFESAMAIYTFGTEQIASKCTFLHTADTAGWAISTIDNLPLDKLSITKCTVEIIDSANNLREVREYSVN